MNSTAKGGGDPLDGRGTHGMNFLIINFARARGRGPPAWGWRAGHGMLRCAGGVRSTAREFTKTYGINFLMRKLSAWTYRKVYAGGELEYLS